MHISFQTPWLLYVIWAIPLLTVLWMARVRRGQRAIETLVAPSLRPRWLPRQGFARAYGQAALSGSGLMLLLIAAAGPRWGEREETVFQQARDLVIALDVSRSMLAGDVHPSRLERAKVDTMDLIASLQGDRAAVLAFRGKPARVCPLTTDYGFLRQTLAGIGPDSAPRGETDIGAALARALDMFSETEAAHKAILLISDGEDLSGQALDMADRAAQRGIPIFTVGLGSRQGAPIPDPDRPGELLEFEGKPVISRLNHESLLAIAQRSGGSYIPIETAGTGGTTLGTLYRDYLREISRREIAESRRRRAIERYQGFLFPALILLSAAAILSRGRLSGARRRSGKRGPDSPPLKDLSPPERTIKPLVIAWIALPLCATGIFAGEPSKTAEPADTPTGHDAARAAQRLYHRGDYAGAAALYRRARGSRSRHMERQYRYNEAIALAKAGNPTDAVALLRELALQQRPGDHDVTPALGWVLHQIAQAADPSQAAGATARVNALRQSAEAFKEAWRQDPENRPDARHNLAALIEQIPAAEEQAKALRLAEQYAQTPVPELLDILLRKQRDLTASIPPAAERPLPERIERFESLARRQEALSDIWMPLGARLMAELTAQSDAGDDPGTRQAIGAMQSLMEVTRENMDESRKRLRDVRTDGFRPAKMAEQGTYQLWKSVADYGRLLAESIRQQTNIIAQTKGEQPADPVLSLSEQQQENGDLTERFRIRFEAQIPPEGTSPTPPPDVPAGERQASSDPHAITPDVRARILDLADQATREQHAAAERIARGAHQDALDAQQRAYGNLQEIAKLLPPPESPPEPSPPQKEDASEPSPPEPAPEPSAEPERQDERTESPPDPKPETDIEKILRQAIEREREHEEEKRRRQNRIPLPPSARDW